MELQSEMERCLAAMLMDDLSFYRESPRDIGYQSLIYLNLIRYTDRCTDTPTAAPSGGCPSCWTSTNPPCPARWSPW